VLQSQGLIDSARPLKAAIPITKPSNLHEPSLCVYALTLCGGEEDDLANTLGNRLVADVLDQRRPDSAALVLLLHRQAVKTGAFQA